MIALGSAAGQIKIKIRGFFLAIRCLRKLQLACEKIIKTQLRTHSHGTVKQMFAVLI